MTGFARPRAGLRQAVAAEWTKLRSLRSTVAALAAVAVTTVGTAGLVAATGSLQPADTVLGGSLGNAALGLVAAGAVGVLAITGEFRSGTIRATFAACPRRLTVLAAKVVVVTAVVFAVALASAVAAYLLGGALLSGPDRPPGDPMPALVGVALCYAAVAALGVALGAVLRNAAAGVTAVTGLLLLPVLLGPLLGGLQPWLAGSTPVAALQKLVQSADAAGGALGSLPAWPTLAVVCGFTVAVLTLGGYLLRRRDA